VTDALAATLPELRASGNFDSALVWDAEARCPLVLDGDEPPSGLDAELRRASQVEDGGVLRLRATGPGDPQIGGWAAPLPGNERWVVLLGSGSPATHQQSVFAEILAGLAMIVAAAGAQAD
jgi:hypothetical protein